MPYLVKHYTRLGTVNYIHRTGTGAYQTYPSRHKAVHFRTMRTAQKAVKQFGFNASSVRYLKVL